MSEVASGRFSAAVIPAAKLVPLARWGMWIIAGLLLSISLVGNYIQFNGGWGQRWEWSSTSWQALAYAIGWQAICSVLQFAFLYTKSWPAYFFFLLGSIIPSFLSYHPALSPVVTAYLASQHMPLAMAQSLAAFFIAAGVAGSDWLPERILVRR